MLEKLEFMLALAREKHFRRAADSCGVAQPTLSLGIQSLEDMLNVSLVKRSSRFQGFTPEGERVLAWARRIVGDAQAMRQEILSLQRGLGPRIKIAAMPSAMHVVSALTVPYQQRNPETRFTVLARPSDMIVEMLHRREIDAGITYIDNEPIEDVSAIPLFREEYLLLTQRDGPLGSAKTIRWRDAAAIPLCLLTREFQHRRIMDNVVALQRLHLSPVLETDSETAIATHVISGLCCSIVRRSMLETLNMSKLWAIPLVEPDVARTIGIVVSQRFSVQPGIEAMMADARKLSTLEPAAA